MSHHRYPSASTNPFEEDDIDDETFLKNARRPPPSSSFDAEMQSFQERKQAIENRTISSTEKSLSILRDSEQIGIATAEELSRQREKLERTDRQLDEINSTLRFSQKHINGIKSVFSSLKNYMAGRNDAAATPPKAPTEPATAYSNDFDAFESHPSTRIRGLDEKSQQRTMEGNSAGGSRDFSAKLDANLAEMCTNISRLKHLATDMSVEIDAQNYLIDGITDKAEVADITIKRQNKDMMKILKK